MSSWVKQSSKLRRRRPSNIVEIYIDTVEGLYIGIERIESYLRDTLAVLAAVQDSPGNATGVLSLQEQRLRLAILETEDLAVATDVDFTLQTKQTLARKTDLSDNISTHHRARRVSSPISQSQVVSQLTFATIPPLATRSRSGTGRLQLCRDTVVEGYGIQSIRTLPG